MTTAPRVCPSCNGWIELPDADAALLELQRFRQHQAEVHAIGAAALRLLDEDARHAAAPRRRPVS